GVRLRSISSAPFGWPTLSRASSLLVVNPLTTITLSPTRRLIRFAPIVGEPITPSWSMINIRLCSPHRSFSLLNFSLRIRPNRKKGHADPDGPPKTSTLRPEQGTRYDLPAASITVLRGSISLPDR